jgi:DUF4097 and DUF4098 domain-containing protein YvlB
MSHEQQFDVQEPVMVEVRIASGDVVVTTAEIDQARVILDGADAVVEATSVLLRGNVLTIKHDKEKGLRSVISRGDLRGLLQGSLDVEVVVPHGSSFDLASASADARLEGEFIEVIAKTASGDLRARGEVFGDLNVKNASGDVTAEHVGGDVRIQSVSGDVRIGAVDGSVNATSVSGDIELLSLYDGEVRIQSVSGDIELGVAQGVDVDVDASSTSGTMHSEVPLSDTPTPTPAATAQTVVIRARTVSGDLRITRSPERGRLVRA